MSASATAMTPDDYRRRYFELKQQAEENNAGALSQPLRPNPREISQDHIVLEESIPPGWYWTGRVEKGATLRIVNDEATKGVSALFWNAHDTSERYNAGDTVKVQWSSRLSRGRLLLSDMGRVIASITDDTSGMHDFIAGGSTKLSNLRNYGPCAPQNPDGRNSHDNFVLAASKHGLTPRDVGPCVTFFAPVTVDESGRFIWQDGAVTTGDYIDLRAEMDLIVALSNCPHPLSPTSKWNAAPVRAIVWRSPPVESSDFCRSATGEAVRAFANTHHAERS